MKSTLRHLLAVAIGLIPVAGLLVLVEATRHGEIRWEAGLVPGRHIPILSVIPTLLAAVVVSWAFGAFALAQLHEHKMWGLRQAFGRSYVSDLVRWMQVLVGASGLAGLQVGYGQNYRIFRSVHEEGHLWTPFSLTVDLAVASFLVCCVAVGIMEMLASPGGGSQELPSTGQSAHRGTTRLPALVVAAQVVVASVCVTFTAWAYRVFHPLDRDWPLVSAHMVPQLRRYLLGMPLASKILLGLDVLIAAWALGWCVWALVVLLVWWRRGHDRSPTLLCARQIAVPWVRALFALQLTLFFILPCDRNGRLGVIAVPHAFSAFPPSIVIDVWAALLGLSAIALTLWSVGGTVVESLVRLLKRRDEQCNAEASA